MVLAVACLFTGDGLAALGAREGMPFGLGQALSMPALPGGQAQHDPSDAQTMAERRRGGMRPHAYVAPAKRRATRDRRRHRMRQRAERVTQGQHTHAQDHWPKMGQQIASQTQRPGGHTH